MKKILTTVNAFLLAVFVFLTATAGVAYATLLNPDFMVRSLSQKGYADEIYAGYSRQLEYLAEPAGVDAQVLKDAVGKAEMVQTLRQMVYFTYDPSDPRGQDLDVDGILLRYKLRLNEYAEQQGYAIEDEVEIGIHNIAALAIMEFGRYATLPFMKQFGGYLGSAKNIVFIAFLVSIGITALLAVCLFLGKSRSGGQKASGLVWALSGAGLLTAVWPVAVLLFGKLSYLNVQIRPLYLFMQNYIKDILYIFLGTGIALLVLAVAAFFLVYRPLSKRD